MEKAVNIPKVRESNIELCRIICMLMIIGHHLVLHGGLLSQPDIFANKIIGYIIYPGGKVGFDAFIAISAWFLAGSDFKAERFMKTYLQVIFYSVATMIAASILGTALTPLQMIGTIFPLTGAVQGYAATYLAFYLLMPFLAVVSRNITDSQHRLIVGILTVFVIVSKVVGSLATTEQFCYSRVTLFVFFYFLLGYIKKHPIKALDNPALMLLVFIADWCLILLYNCCSLIWPSGDLSFFTATSFVVGDESGLLFIIGGLSLFFFFKGIKIKPNKVINLFAGTTLAVLLIHDGHFSRTWTWTLLKTSEWYYSKNYILIAAACIVGIYLFCSVIEFLRRQLLEKPLFRAKWMKQLCISFDEAAHAPAKTDTSAAPITDSAASAEIAELKKELDRKDHALAELAARYALKED